MKTRFCIAALALAAFAAPVGAQESPHSLPTVRAEAKVHVVDCQDRSLPSQRQVGEWTGHHNVGQVYDARRRLMSEIGRVCQQAGVGRVQVVSSMDPAPRDLSLVAVADRRGH